MRCLTRASLRENEHPPSLNAYLTIVTLLPANFPFFTQFFFYNVFNYFLLVFSYQIS